MSIHDYDVFVFHFDSGQSPFHDWLTSIRDKKSVSIIETRLNRIRSGLLGDYKSVGLGVYELRIFYGSGFRLYFGFYQETIVVLLFGGDKSTQSKDILKAYEYWQYFLRKNHEKR